MDFKLLIKKLNNTLTEEEAIQFSEWYNDSQAHKDYFKKVKTNYRNNLENINTFKAWNAVEAKIDGTAKTTSFWKYRIAASLILLIAFSFYFIVNKNTKVEHAISIGTDKAILTLQDGSNITLEKGEIFSTEHMKSDGHELVYDTDPMPIHPEIHYNYLTVPLGGQFIINLADGTKVWLNSNSQLKYPESFAKGKPRAVELVYGEAFFDVSPSSNHDGSNFIVKSSDQVIEVLGTQFNLKAYKEDTSITTTLVEGRITIGDEGVNSEILTPGEQSNFIKDSHALTKTIVPNVKFDIAWKNGYFMFDKQPLSEIMKTLSRWYNVRYEFTENAKEQIIFSGNLKKTQNIDNILNYFAKTNEVDFDIENKTIIIR